MDIVFAHKTRSCYREFADPVKRVQVSAESVVPDTREDIGRIASVRTQVLLKSKEVSSRGVAVTGELDTVLLYITEDEKEVTSLRLRKDFSLEFEEEYPLDTLAHVRLSVVNTEARILNPRKVAVTVEVLAELSCFCRDEAVAETQMPEESAPPLHGRRESMEAVLVNGVCEKTFVLNEQFRFPDGRPAPTLLCAQSADFVIEDVQQVGSRAVVKGKVYLDVCYQTADGGCPEQLRFTSLFSQIVDTGAEECVSATGAIELTGAYYELADTIGGEKALDAELHALLQLTSRCRQQSVCFTDVYGNRCPTQCVFQKQSLPEVSEEQRLRLRGETELSIAEDCDEVLSIFAAPSAWMLSGELPVLTVGLDVLYRRKSGELSAARRQVELRGEAGLTDARLYGGRIVHTDLHGEGGTLRGRLEAELDWQRFGSRERSIVTGVTLREEEPYPAAELPSVTLVRPAGEELWELAKRYHSSEEAIRSVQEALGGESGAQLLIPREN